MASPRLVLTGAVAAQASVSLIGFGLPAIGPELAAAYDIGLAALGALLTANLLGSGLFLIPAGVVVDRYGSRVPLLVGSSIGSAALVGAALSESPAVAFVALLIAGIGASVVPVAGFGALMRVYEPSRRAWALGVRQMAVPLGGMVAALALPGLDALGGIQLALLVSAGVVLVFSVAFALVAEASPPAHERPRIEVHRLIRAPGMMRLLVVATLYIVVLQAVLVYTIPSARSAGFSALVAGAAFFVLNVTAAVARIVWGWIADFGGGRRRVRTLAEAGGVAALGAGVFTAALHGGAALVIVAMVILSFGALGWNALVYVAAGEKAPPALAAQAVAIAATIVFVVSAVSTPPMGALASHAGWDAFWLVCAALAAVGAIVALTLPRDDRLALAE
jgi:MFS family permease